jgi:hypothetical protein
MLQLPNAAHAHAKAVAGNKNTNCSNSSHVKPTKDLKHSNANKKMAAMKNSTLQTNRVLEVAKLPCEGF